MPSEARRQATMVDLDDVYMDADLNNRFIGDTDDETKELAASIESTNGLLQPIGIAPTPESHKTSHDKPYELVWGFRRCRALRYLDECNGTNAWTKNVDAVLEEASTKDRIVNQLIENLQRKDLNPMEVALSMKSALEDKEAGLNQTDLAKLIGMAVPTVSNYLKAATKLSTNIQGLVLAGKLGWSHAKVIMGLDIPTEQQEQLAGIASVQEDGTSMTIGEFEKHVKSVYKKDDASTDEATTETSEEKATSQKAHKSIRATDLENKYIPRIAQMVQESEGSQKVELELRLDTIKWFLNMAGTGLGALLAPWEQQLEEQKESEKASNEKKRARIQYVKQCVLAIQAKLREVPPEDAEDRHMMTLPMALTAVKATIEADLAKAKEAGLEVNAMPQGFTVENIDAFLEEISAARTEYIRITKERAEKSKKAREEKERKEKEAADAAAQTGEGEGQITAETEAVTA